MHMRHVTCVCTCTWFICFLSSDSRLPACRPCFDTIQSIAIWLASALERVRSGFTSTRLLSSRIGSPFRGAAPVAVRSGVHPFVFFDDRTTSCRMWRGLACASLCSVGFGQILPARPADSQTIEQALRSGKSFAPYGGVILEPFDHSSANVSSGWLLYEASRFVQHHHLLPSIPALHYTLSRAAASSSGGSEGSEHPSPVCGQLYYSEDGLSRTGIDYNVTVPGTVLGSGAGTDPDLRVTEPETVYPLLGYLCWLHVQGRHTLPALNPDGSAVKTGAGMGSRSREGATDHQPASAEAQPPQAEPVEHEVTHHLVVSISAVHGDLNVYSYTYGCGVEGSELCTSPSRGGTGQAAVSSDGSQSVTGSSSSTASASHRVLTYNVWNVNPPAWLWRDPRDRKRQYDFRLFGISDVLAQAEADTIAFQEVRYDASLGGWDKSEHVPSWAAHEPLFACPEPPASNSSHNDSTTGPETAALPAPTPPVDCATHVASVLSSHASAEDALYSTLTKPARGQPFDHAFAHNVAQFWYNWTQTFTSNARFLDKGKGKWEAVRAAEGWKAYGAAHPSEGQRTCGEAPAAASPSPSAAPSGTEGQPEQQAEAEQKGCSPYIAEGLSVRADPSRARMQRAMRRHPHAQIMHLAAALPLGWHFTAQPASFYLDREPWIKGSKQRDEEGPAIFSRWPLAGSRAVLLSRNTSDEGDGHQRLVLHASVHLPAAGGLLDIFTVHLSLSEAARNRSVVELHRFVSETSTAASASPGGGRRIGAVLTGDMNAEPHEPALQQLVAAPEPPPGATSSVSGLHLRDAWLEVGYPEPEPRSPDAAVRRYGHTFPSDNPVKRIDMVYIGGARLSASRAWLLGQDALPGTDGYEGKGTGMVGEQSPIWPSDHRAVAVDLQLQVNES